MSYYAVINGNIQFASEVPSDIRRRIDSEMSKKFLLSDYDFGKTFIEVWNSKINYDEDEVYDILNAIKNLHPVQKGSALSFEGEDHNMWKISFDGEKWGLYINSEISSASDEELIAELERRGYGIFSKDDTYRDVVKAILPVSCDPYVDGIMETNQIDIGPDDFFVMKAPKRWWDASYGSFEEKDEERVSRT